MFESEWQGGEGGAVELKMLLDALLSMQRISHNEAKEFWLLVRSFRQTKIVCDDVEAQ